MSIARVGTGAALVSVQNTTQAVVTYTPGGSGRLLVVQGGALYTGTDGTLTVTDNLSSTWTVILKRSTAAQQSYTYLAYLENCPAGITSVTVSFNQSAVYGHAKLDEWTGAATVSPVDAQLLDIATPAPKNTLATGNLTPTDPNCLIYGVAEAEYSGGVSTTWTTTLGSFTELDQYGDSFNNVFTQGIFQIASGSTGPFSITWVPPSFADGEMMSILVAFAPPAAGTTVSPGAGSLALAGAAPTIAVTNNKTVTPGVGALRLVGLEPQLFKHLFTVGDKGDLSYVGGDALVGGLEPPQATVVLAGLGTLVLFGLAPTVVATSGGNVTILPGLGSLALTGLAPATIQDVIRGPGLGTLTLAGAAPTTVQNSLRTPGAGTLTLTGLAPVTVQDNIRSPGAGALTLSGAAPTAVQDNIRPPGAGALVLAGLAPVATQDSLRAPSAGTLTLSGLAPAVLQAGSVSPGAGALVLAGLAPAAIQNVIVQPGAGALVLAGQAPATLNGDAHVVQPGAGALVLAGRAPGVLADITTAPGVGALALAGAAPTVLATSTVRPGAGALVLAGAAPTLSVSSNVIANPLTGALIFTGLAPTAAVSDNQTVTPGAGTLVLAGAAPTIPIPSPTVTPDPGALFLEGLAPGILVSGDDLLSAKFIARHPNVHMQGLQGKKRKEEVEPKPEPLPPEITNMPGTEPVVKKARGLDLGLITAPPTPAPALPVVEVPAIKVTTPVVASEEIVVKPAEPASVPPPAPPKPPKPVPATRADVQSELAQLYAQILEATKTQGEQMLLAIDTLTARVEEMQAQIEADAKARDLRERNIQRAKQIAERMLRDLGK